jgi:hypothetical protein
MFDCSAASCVRQVSGKKTYINFLIESECRHAKANSCKYPKYVRRPHPGETGSRQTHFTSMGRAVQTHFNKIAVR